jgi:antitoxin (DNA-binding transcriptional repressor) of toxin-antitoxin stability system
MNPSTVSLRRLYHSAGSIVERVRRGEIVIIQNRGEPAAIMIPLDLGGILERARPGFRGAEIESAAAPAGARDLSPSRRTLSTDSAPPAGKTA